MVKVMDFFINARSPKRTLYTIYETNEIQGKKGFLGYADYNDKIIVLEKAELYKMVETLKHELMHVWLEEKGCDQDKCFNVEELCDIVAYSNSFINSVVEDYYKKKLQKGLDTEIK